MSRPAVFDAAAPAVVEARVADENGEQKTVCIAGEYPLTLYVDKREVATLMTLGQMPAALAIGWLRNQQLITALDELEEVRVDWEAGAVAVYTRAGNFLANDDERRVITSGCGQGSMFAKLMDDIKNCEFKRGAPLAAAAVANLLAQLRERPTIYKNAGAVHGCALASHNGGEATPLCFVEDIGRHNAVDSIAGWMWLNNINGDDKIFYTTGRLTSEMVIKCAQMGAPYLVSRSGTTRMGYEVARQTGITMLGRAINRRFLVFSGAAHFCA